MTPRRRRALKIVAALLSGPVLLVLLGEAWVRVRHPAYADQWRALTSHPRWARTLRPGASGRLRELGGGYDTTFSINGQGLREAREVGAKRPGVPRVVCVGDSHTFGLGVDDGQVWVRALEQGGRVEAIDAGWAAGYAPDCAAVWLEGVGLGFQPDLVVQQLTPSNDLDDMTGKSVWELDAAGRLTGVSHAWDHRVPVWIQALGFPRYLARQVLPAMRGAPVPASGPDADAEGLRRLRVALEQERALLQARGVKLVVLLFPDAEELLDADGQARAAARRRSIATVARELGLDLLDPQGSPEWTAAAPPRFHRDGHLTVAGNAAVGAAVARELATRLR